MHTPDNFKPTRLGLSTACAVVLMVAAAGWAYYDYLKKPGVRINFGLDASESQTNAPHFRLEDSCLALRANLTGKDDLFVDLVADNVINVLQESLENPQVEGRLCNHLEEALEAHEKTYELGLNPGTRVDQYLQQARGDVIYAVLHAADNGPTVQNNWALIKQSVEQHLERNTVVIFVGASPQLQNQLRHTLPQDPRLFICPLQSTDGCVREGFQKARDIKLNTAPEETSHHVFHQLRSSYRSQG